MQRRTTFTLAGAAAVVTALAIGGGIAVAGGGDDAEPAITGADLERASAAALEHTGGGSVTDTEVGDEESLYEVEVTLDGGSQVDVQLDADFSVVAASADIEEVSDTD